MRILVTAIIMLLLLGCQDGGGNNIGNGAVDGTTAEPRTEVLADEEERMMLEIRNLTPTTVTADEPVTFTFDVAYNLVGHAEGVINIGFNSWNAYSYAFLSTKAIVSEGKGVERFTVTVTPVKWEAPLAFKLNVSLSENPHPSSWQPLLTATQEIEVVEGEPQIKRRSAISVAPAQPLSASIAEECYEDVNLGEFFCNQF